MTWRAALIFTIALASCRQPAQPDPEPDPAATVMSAPLATQTASADKPAMARPLDFPAAEPTLVRALEEGAVHHGDVATRKLYTWTRKHQADALRKHRRLLTRTMSPERGYALFDDRLRQTPALGPVASMLQEDALKYRRFAWSSPWPTLMGWGVIDYGDQLLEVTLAKEAIIAVLDSRTAGWRFVTATGEAVAEPTALKSPERIGAIYHVWHGDRETGREAELGNPAPFREYVLCNESMVERWSLSTEAMRRGLLEQATMLEGLADYLHQTRRPAPAELAPWSHHVEGAIWPKAPPGDDAVRLYEANLALPSEPYLPQVDRLRTLAERLRKTTLPGAALTHEVKVRYGEPPPASARPKPPPPIQSRPCDPTMMLPCPKR